MYDKHELTVRRLTGEHMIYQQHIKDYLALKLGVSKEKLYRLSFSRYMKIRNRYYRPFNKGENESSYKG